MLTLENVLYEKKGAVAYVTVNRPKVLNPLNAAVRDELRAAFEDAQTDPAIHGVIVTGPGDPWRDRHRSRRQGVCRRRRHRELARLGPVEAEETIRQGQALFDQIENLGKPVVAAINGFALGGGCELALACTLRIAVEDAKFGQPEVRLGLIPGGGGTQRLPRLVGKGRALHMVLTGELISAQEAWRIGLVNEIVPRAGLIARAEAILQQIAANAPIAIRHALEAVNRGMETSQAEGLVIERSLFAICAATADKKEGTAAFLEKRAPQFHGR